MHGINSLLASCSRVLGPIAVTDMFGYFGPQLVWVFQFGVWAVLLAIFAIFYKRLVPLEMPKVAEEEEEEARWASSCVFDKVEVVHGVEYLTWMRTDESGCFTECFKNNACIALWYYKDEGRCFLSSTGNVSFPCDPDEICYTLHRDEEDSVCARYVDV
ncbi:unnamed protein product [Cylicocyclus nassatus]|uniref:Uncharacterized protein n=1 Tax=Cylicocyclus nassatus TaxID=53992 RepID=A0AA36GXA0_CYLNA|nr:unnamed protein product [Cylicocyclus nassatus]